MVRASAGDTGAFDELYCRYQERAFRLAWSVCRDQGRAEDAVQDAFLSIWRSCRSYSTQRGSVAAWVLTVVRYRAIDLVRRHGSAANHEADGIDMDQFPSDEGVDQAVLASEERERVHTLLTRLPDTQHEVITLAFYGQLTHTEIASQLGLPAGTVKGRMRLGMEKLRADLTAPEA